MSGYQSSDVPKQVPHTSYTHSCTIYSMDNMAMNLMRYSVESRDGEPETASFTIFNPGPGDEYGISNIAVQDDGEWHECGGGAHSLPWQLLSCQYLLDQASNKVGFQFQWNCDDRDPYHAYVPFPLPLLFSTA